MQVQDTDPRRFGIQNEREFDATGHFERDVDPAVAALAPLRHALRAWLESRDLSARSRDAVILATHEAVANAIQHSGTVSRIRVRANAEAGGLTIEISDNGEWRTPDDPPSQERGRGIALIRSLVSNATINTDAGGTTVLLYQLA